MIKAIGQPAGVLGLRVRYETIASGLQYLTAAPADQTLPRRLHYYFEFDLTILDEIGFNGVERPESPHAPSLLYELINARSGRSTTRRPRRSSKIGIVVHTIFAYSRDGFTFSNRTGKP